MALVGYLRTLRPIGTRKGRTLVRVSDDRMEPQGRLVMNNLMGDSGRTKQTSWETRDERTS